MQAGLRLQHMLNQTRGMVMRMWSGVRQSSVLLEGRSLPTRAVRRRAQELPARRRTQLRVSRACLRREVKVTRAAQRLGLLRPQAGCSWALPDHLFFALSFSARRESDLTGPMDALRCMRARPVGL